MLDMVYGQNTIMLSNLEKTIGELAFSAGFCAVSISIKFPLGNKICLVRMEKIEKRNIHTSSLILVLRSMVAKVCRGRLNFTGICEGMRSFHIFSPARQMHAVYYIYLPNK